MQTNNSNKVKTSFLIYHYFLVYLPVILIFGLILFIYISYLLTYIIILLNGKKFDEETFPLLHTTSHRNGYTKGIVFISITSFSLLMLTIALLRTVFMDPGYFPDPLELEHKIILKNSRKKKKLNEDNEYTIDDEKFQFLKNFNTYISEGPLTNTEIEGAKKKICKLLNGVNANTTIDEDKNDIFNVFKGENLSKLPLCNTCLRWKVERSHHCRNCGRCVLKMDHHCPWLANCIGFRNYKYFCLVHFYGIIATLMIAFTYWEVILNNNLHFDTNIFHVFFSSFVYVCNLGLFGFLLWLFLVNWNLVLTGQTVIENSDRERFPSAKNENLYNLGTYRNFTTVFGNNPLVWFLPFFANYTGNGVVYEKIK